MYDPKNFNSMPPPVVITTSLAKKLRKLSHEGETIIRNGSVSYGSDTSRYEVVTYGGLHYELDRYTAKVSDLHMHPDGMYRTVPAEADEQVAA